MRSSTTHNYRHEKMCYDAIETVHSLKEKAELYLQAVVGVDADGHLRALHSHHIESPTLVLGVWRHQIVEVLGG